MRCRLIRRAAAVVAVAVTIAGLVVPGAAWARSAPVSADPPPGAALATAPVEVTLTFGSDVDAGSSHVAVLDAAGVDVATGDPRQPQPRQLRLPVRITASGDFTVAYHVTFTEGTEVTGFHRFSVGTGVAPPPLDETLREAAADTVEQHSHGIDGVSATMLIVDAAVLFGALALLWLRPRDGRTMSRRLPPGFGQLDR
jgi:methionine-rich copper-binding protein CopC